MDYTKMTKQELIEKLEEQVHLAEAVRAKDKEIIELNKKQDEERARNITEIARLTEASKGAMKKEDGERLAKALHYYVTAYRDLIKVLKLNTDLAISHEELLAGLLK